MAVVQYTFTHKQYTKRHKTYNVENNTNILEECGPCPIFAGFTLAFALQLRKKHEKTSVRVAEERQLARWRYINIQYEYIDITIIFFVITLKYNMLCYVRNVFLVQCHHMSFVDLPPGHGRSVTDFWSWDAHKAQLRCPDGVWVVIEEDVVPGGALNLNSTNLPRPWSPRDLPLQGKFPR